jgi:DNA-binding NarL/FixJ family response regulator
MRVLLADDHRLMVEALTGLLTAHGLEVVGTAADGYEAAAQARALHPDLVLMDLRMPNCDGLAATRLIKAGQPEVRVVILTTSAEDDDLFAAIQSGACGYLIKSISGGAFIEALQGLEEGIPPFSPGLAARLLGEFARLAAGTGGADTGGADTSGADTGGAGTGGATDAGPAPAEGADAAALPAPEGPVSLTERQVEVLRMVASGMTYREAGLALYISERTVRHHMAEIMARLHLEHRAQVIAYAGRLGLADASE